MNHIPAGPEAGSLGRAFAGYRRVAAAIMAKTIVATTMPAIFSGLGIDWSIAWSMDTSSCFDAEDFDTRLATRQPLR